MRLIIVAVMLALCALAPSAAEAMTFRLATTSDGLKVVLGSGEIKQGDARRFAKALKGADRDRHGALRLYLDSDGGMVLEALRLAELIVEHEVATIVRRDATCASACASIVFVAGKYRTVEKGGQLAIHSCYDRRDGRAASECNALISEHAEASGVSGVTMMALQEAAGGDGVIVFGADDAACYGLTLKPGERPIKKAPCMHRLPRIAR